MMYRVLFWSRPQIMLVRITSEEEGCAHGSNQASRPQRRQTHRNLAITIAICNSSFRIANQRIFASLELTATPPRLTLCPAECRSGPITYRSSREHGFARHGALPENSWDGITGLGITSNQSLLIFGKQLSKSQVQEVLSMHSLIYFTLYRATLTESGNNS